MKRTLSVLIAAALLYVSFTGCNNTNTAIPTAIPAVNDLWGTKQLGVAGAMTEGYAVATDANGNIFVAGNSDKGLDGNALIGVTDGFLAKYDSTGAKKWVQQLGAAGVVIIITSAATDTSGNIIVAGRTYGGLDGNLLTGISDFFVTKYDTSGTKIWTRQLGIAGVGTQAWSVTTDMADNIFVAGETFGGLDGNLLTGTRDAFVTKYNSLGVKQWTMQSGVVGASTFGYSVATDAAGNILLAGYTDGGLDGNVLMGIQDFFLIKYDPAGVKLWTNQLGAAVATTFGCSVATDAAGNIVIGGYTNGGLDGNLVTGVNDLFITLFDTAGVKQWTRQLGTAGVSLGIAGWFFYPNSVAIDTSGNIIVSSVANGGFDGNQLIGIFDAVVTKYNAAGIKQWTRQQGVPAVPTVVRSVATDTSDNIYLVGTASGGLDGNTIIGFSDSYLTKFNTNGIK